MGRQATKAACMSKNQEPRGCCATRSPHIVYFPKIWEAASRRKDVTRHAASTNNFRKNGNWPYDAQPHPKFVKVVLFVI